MTGSSIAATSGVQHSQNIQQAQHHEGVDAKNTSGIKQANSTIVERGNVAKLTQIFEVIKATNTRFAAPCHKQSNKGETEMPQSSLKEYYAVPRSPSETNMILQEEPYSEPRSPSETNMLLQEEYYAVPRSRSETSLILREEPYSEPKSSSETNKAFLIYDNDDAIHGRSNSSMESHYEVQGRSPEGQYAELNEAEIYATIPESSTDMENLEPASTSVDPLYAEIDNGKVGDNQKRSDKANVKDRIKSIFGFGKKESAHSSNNIFSKAFSLLRSRGSRGLSRQSSSVSIGSASIQQDSASRVSNKDIQKRALPQVPSSVISPPYNVSSNERGVYSTLSLSEDSFDDEPIYNVPSNERGIYSKLSLTEDSFDDEPIYDDMSTRESNVENPLYGAKLPGDSADRASEYDVLQDSAGRSSEYNVLQHEGYPAKKQ